MSKFFGDTPLSTHQVSSRSSSQPPSRSSPSGDLIRNAAKFFMQGDATPNTQKQEFDINASKFYNNSPIRHSDTKFDNLRHPNSINNPRPSFTAVNNQAADYVNNVGKFYGVSSRGSDADSTSHMNYKFRLSRQEAVRAEKEREHTGTNTPSAAGLI